MFAAYVLHIFRSNLIEAFMLGDLGQGIIGFPVAFTNLQGLAVRDTFQKTRKRVPRRQNRAASTEQTQRSPGFEPAPRGRGWPETWFEIQKRRVGLPVVEDSG